MKTNLLTRGYFRKSVFDRDFSKCVVCGKDAVDAHHIVDRGCFKDGGYYLDNGISLCTKHHIEAENGLISCTTLRSLANITNIILPDNFDEKYDYNKWGEVITEGNKIKYGRTSHFSWSLGITNDDKVQYDLSNLEGKEIVVTEKMDGENSTLMKICNFARSLDSNNHPSRDFLKGLWGKIQYDIPENWRICGENLYAKHSIYYDNLPSYFLVFNIWNDSNVCLSWDDTVEWCNLLSLEHVPVLYRGIYDETILKNLANSLDTEKQEGFVVRLTDSFRFSDFSKSIVKYVRKNHVQTDEHWTSQPITPNKLK